MWRLLMFSCKTRGSCPSCHAKRIEEWGEWMRGKLVLDAPHRQVIFTEPKMFRTFFKYKRLFLREPCQTAVQALLKFFLAVTGTELVPGGGGLNSYLRTEDKFSPPPLYPGD
jgi:hypothetical protein